MTLTLSQRVCDVPGGENSGFRRKQKKKSQKKSLVNKSIRDWVWFFFCMHRGTSG